MKKILSLAAVASMALTANAADKSPYQGKDYKDWGKLQLVGNQLSDKDGKPVQLKGWSTFSLHYGEVQGCLGKGQWELMKAYGANIVRLAMYIDENNSYKSNPTKFKQMIKESIAETKELNMYCLVDWHILRIDSNSNTSGDPNKYTSEAKDFFSEISKYCADNGYDHVLYELCNEPTCGWSNIKSYAEQVIPMITANQPDAIIIVGTDQWCQKITEPMSAPISANYKKNVMYSFHYYACTHKYLLGDFRNAQSNIPVFVSEWSAVNFDGNGPFCSGNGDEMIAACEYQDAAPQVVSWCIWNWGKKNEASSFFTGTCSVGNESKYDAKDSNQNYGDYVMIKMAGEIPDIPIPETGPWSTINSIPTTAASAWHWDYYDRGGEGVAYHDGNGTAWDKDKKGNFLGYKIGQEVDVFSLAYDLELTTEKCKWAEVDKSGKIPVVKSFDDEIATEWKNADGEKTYRSLNGGRMYSGTDGSARPDEGVDLSTAGCQGTDYEGGYCNLGWVEPEEWIKYTVKVDKPGYYKISGIVSAEYKNLEDNGEISIVSDRGNHLRTPDDLANNEAITTFGFVTTETCADPTKSKSAPWDCWSEQDAFCGYEADEVYCAFGFAGETKITVRFMNDCGGVGPLMFKFVGDLDENDPIKKDPSNVSDVEVINFSIYPNPTSGEFTVAIAESGEATVEVVNMAGQVVASQKVEGSAKINKALAAGVYTVVVKSNGAVSTKKLVVK